MTMIKAVVDDHTDNYIEHIRDTHEGMNKTQAAAYVLKEAARGWEDHDSND